MEEKGYTITLRSRYEGWWRYNVALMCGCFNAENQRTGFVSAESHVADVGANLTKRPADILPDRKAVLNAPACDHLILYIYIVPHTLPTGSDIEATAPFEVELKISCNGKQLLCERRQINQWSGASVEMRVPAAE